MDKKFYKQVKVIGLMSIVPFVLAAGPLTGYVAADYLKTKFGAPPWVYFVVIFSGFAAGMTETIRLIKEAMRTGKEL